MDLNVRQYKNKYKAAISELISENNFVKEDIKILAIKHRKTSFTVVTGNPTISNVEFF